MNCFYSGLVFASVLVVTTANTDIAPDSTSHSRFLGFGYNLYKGNPHSAGNDPGFTQSVFDVKSSNLKRTNDVGQQSSWPPFESETVWDTVTFEKALLAGIDLDNSIIGGRFSADHDYQKVKRKLQNQKSVFLESTTQKGLSHVMLPMNDLPSMSDTFEKAVKSLPAEYNDETRHVYMTFLSTFGTHVVTEVTSGARCTVRYEISWDNYGLLLGEGLDMEDTASFLAAQEAGIDQTKFFKLPSDLVRTFNDQSISTVYTAGNSDPVPVRYSLKSISKFLSESSAEQVKKAIEDFYDNHYSVAHGSVRFEKPQPLWPQPEYSLKWKSHGNCIVTFKQFEDRKGITCPDGWAMASLLTSRRRLHLLKGGVAKAESKMGCIRNTRFDDVGGRTWTRPETRTNGLKFQCGGNRAITGIKFGHRKQRIMTDNDRQ